MLDRLKHLFGRHKYVYIQRLSSDSHQLGCKYCKKRFAINTALKTLVEWDLELEDFHLGYKNSYPIYSKNGKVNLKDGTEIEFLKSDSFSKEFLCSIKFKKDNKTLSRIVLDEESYSDFLINFLSIRKE